MRKNGQSPPSPKESMWRGACPVRGDEEGQSEVKDRPRRTGSAKKGVRMEMLLLQPSLEPELCLGRGALCRASVLNSWTPILCLSEGLGSTQCSLHSAQWLCQKTVLVGLSQTVPDFNVLIFLGSKKYLLPHYLTHNGTQGPTPFIWAHGKGRKRNSHCG